MINRLIRQSSSEIKERMEELLQGKEIVVNFDEQIVFEQLDQDENAIWSLMLASGYLKATDVEYRGVLREPWYHLMITNLETTAMFSNLFKGWFHQSRSNYNQFMKALLAGDLDAMNYYIIRFQWQHLVTLTHQEMKKDQVSRNDFIMALYWD